MELGADRKVRAREQTRELVGGHFAAHVAHDVVDRSMVEAIAKIGSAMEVATIAEKVESAEVLQVLKQIGVDYIQGFHLAEPCAVDELFPSREAKPDGHS